MSSVAISEDTSAGKLWYMVLTAFVLVFDQFTKYWAAITLSEGDDVHVIRGFLKFSYTENPGIAFGMLGDGSLRWALVAVSVAAIVIVTFYMMRTPPRNSLLLWSLALLAAGICGNLIDRIRLGRVIDFIEAYYGSYHFPVFNVADTAITIGAALMAIELFFAPRAQEATGVEQSESPQIETTTDE
ncbi:MAG: signal peptidase II [Blastocatellia bacterium]|nr:signal peptidase II [Blastocatellia bacterium]